jgi:hypothetical protein
MELSEFIDFSVFSDFDNDDFFICEKDLDHKYYISQDIEGVDRTEGIKMIEKASKSFKSYTKLSNSVITDHIDKDNIKEACFYQSNNNAFYCFYLSLDYDDGTIYFSALLDRKNRKYLAIGSQGESLFIKHHLFDYGDSCGYGFSDGMIKDLDSDDPTKEPMLNKKSHPDEILEVMENYFNTICDNMDGPNTTLLGPKAFNQKSNKMVICNPAYGANEQKFIKKARVALQLSVVPGKYYVWTTSCNHSEELLELYCVMNKDLESVDWEFLDKIYTKNNIIGIHDLKYYVIDPDTKPYWIDKWSIADHSIIAELMCLKDTYDVYVSRDNNNIVNGIKIAYQK